MTLTDPRCLCAGKGAISRADGNSLEICGCPPSRATLIAELRAERAALDNPFDRIAFDNRWDPRLPNLPVGIWLLAYAYEETES